MPTVRIVVDPDFRIGRVNPRLFGSFVEHMGRCVYTGLYEPGHPAADEHGLRRDVLELVRELGVRTVRYPGGNFVSGYRWEDGVGPIHDRPTRLDLAWQTTETNEFGLAEFVTWAEHAEVEPMLAVNLGTRGIHEAVDLLEYCNHQGDTALSGLRAEHGSPKPYAVRLWCLGNEMDGPWQIGHKTADEYGRLAQETGKAMKLVDPSIELVACGSSHRHMPTFGQWEATVLGHCYDEVDYISLHAYYDQHDHDPASFLAAGADMDAFIEGVIATADHVRASRRANKRIMLSFDEWNVIHGGMPDTGSWERAPRLKEETFNVADAVAAGGLLVSLLKHADRVRMACQSQLVNLHGMICTEPGGPAWRQTTYYPFAHMARYAVGDVLRLALDTPTQNTDKYGDVPVLDAAATYDVQSGALSIFAINRHLDEPVDLTIATRGLPVVVSIEHTTLTSTNLSETNTQDAPNRVTPVTCQLAPAQESTLTAQLPPASWNVLRMRHQPPHR